MASLSNSRLTALRTWCRTGKSTQGEAAAHLWLAVLDAAKRGLWGRQRQVSLDLAPHAERLEVRRKLLHCDKPVRPAGVVPVLLRRTKNIRVFAQGTPNSGHKTVSFHMLSQALPPLQGDARPVQVDGTRQTQRCIGKGCQLPMEVRSGRHQETLSIWG